MIKQKEMTPMKLLSNHFRCFEQVCIGLSSPVVLHGHAARGGHYDWSGYQTGKKKGVENDFLRIYRLGLSKGQNTNIGFVFNYLTSSPANVAVTKLVGENLESSRNFSVDEFRKLMNKFNAVLRDMAAGQKRGKVDCDEMYKEFLGIFFCEENLFNSEEERAQITQVTDEYQQAWEEKERAVADKRKRQKALTAKASKIKADVDANMHASEQGCRIAEIKSLMAKLQKEQEQLELQVKDMRHKQHQEMGLFDVNEAIKSAEKDVFALMNDFEEKSKTILASMSNHNKKRIKDSVNK
ncbi:hypothetical protein [Aeromonas sp. MrichA-1]|uniref:hypothetical protein n=1 Tax=Aeromonas sp. MrichA-1 TaxID=2823362 RepID=UPI001B342AEF|nr:hypothetical protein [Aeromonas sp. MrichA-1]MBP4081383.1 hypothetical protein [Aeromonas sp. MrichA-1]